uniref:MYND-type domain-containing protein n=1 Tax=Setaria digitata TaxID=48799 RepID=A0A915Q0H3_9BILA
MASATTTAKLIEEMPLAHVVDSKFADKVCANCMVPVWERDTEEKLSRCGRCKFAYYCNMRCQKKDWLNHKMECSYLSRVAPRIPESTPRLIGRIITALESNEDRNPAFNGRLFASLESQMNQDVLSKSENVSLNNMQMFNSFKDATDIENDVEKKDGFIAIAYVIKDYLPLGKMPPSAEIFNIFCKVLINGLVITDSCLNGIGLGIYIGLSALDHSCKPNAFIIFNGTKAVLRSLDMNITEYNDNDQQKFSLRCTKCKDGFCPYSPDDDYAEIPCKVCGEISVFNFDVVKKLCRQLSACRLLENNLSEMIDLYNKFEEVFSPYNVPLCKFAEAIMALAVGNEKYDEAVEYARKTLLCYRTYYPKGHPSICVRMFEYAKLLMLQHNPKSLPVLRKAFEMICESYGPDSNFASSTVRLLNNLEKFVPFSSP